MTRFSSQQKQELISLHQLQACFGKYGWPSDKIPTDLGEDLMVHIYSNGKAEGVAFYTQLKSITDLEQRKSGDFLAYDSIFVKDITHWEDFAAPVVLIIWDIHLEEGRWELIEYCN